MEMLHEYTEKYGVPSVVNDYGETRNTRDTSIVFPNGWVASIVKNTQHPEFEAPYSVAMCDYNGYFNWSKLNEYGAIDGCIYCETVLDIIIACETIRRLPESCSV